jgi:hypothetical protein
MRGADSEGSFRSEVLDRADGGDCAGESEVGDRRRHDSYGEPKTN